MIKFFLFLLFTLLICVPQLSKAQNDSIIINKSFWGNSYYIKGKRITYSKLENKLNSYTISEEKLYLSDYQDLFGTIILIGGVVFNTYSASYAYSDLKDYGVLPKTKIFYTCTITGLALDITGIILLIKSRSSFSEAIDAYNEYQRKKSTINENRFNLKLNGKGLQFSYYFN